MQRTKRRMIGLYAEHCGRSYEEVERTLDRDSHVAGRRPGLGLTDRILREREVGEERERPKTLRRPGSTRALD